LKRCCLVSRLSRLNPTRDGSLMMHMPRAPSPLPSCSACLSAPLLLGQIIPPAASLSCYALLSPVQRTPSDPALLRYDLQFGKYFCLRERKTTVSQELWAGVVCFLTVCYIIPVNAGILSDSGGTCDPAVHCNVRSPSPTHCQPRSWVSSPEALPLPSAYRLRASLARPLLHPLPPCRLSDTR
jgi:hypothetical protein